MLESNILVFLTTVRIHLARGELAQAEDVLEAASQHAIRTGLAWIAPMMNWERVRIALLKGDLDRARIQARSIEHPAGRSDTLVFIHPYEEINGAGIESIRLDIYLGELERALEQLSAQIESAASALRKRRLVKLYILRALALFAAERHDAAVEAILNAVRLGVGMPAVRSFVDEGERCLMVLKALAGRRTIALDAKSTLYLRSLIEAFHAATPYPSSGLSPKPLLEPISERELQILERLAQGYSNLAVAQQLSLSANTVKWHLRHIYEKLGARNRNEAVFLARRRGLLAH